MRSNRREQCDASRSWPGVLIAALVSVGLVGCAATTGPAKPHAPLDARMESGEPVKIVSVVPQERIVKDFNRSILTSPMITPAPSYYSPGAQASFLLVGVALAVIEKQIGETIDNSRLEAAERELVPLRAEVDDVDFRVEFWGALEESLSQPTWMAVKDLRKSTAIAEAAVDEIPQEPVVTLVTAYSLTKEHAFVCQTVLEYYMAGTKDPAYKLVFEYIDDPFKAIETPAEKVNAWAADNGRAYRKAVDSAIVDTLTVLHSNFLGPKDARQLTQLAAHDPDHRIVTKASGFIASVPVEPGMAGGQRPAGSNSPAAAGILSGNETRNTPSGGDSANPLAGEAVGPAGTLALLENLDQYNGVWSVRMITPKGKTRKGKVVLSDREGTWDINHSSRKNACSGLSAPVVVDEASADGLVFKVLKSRALRGCSDFTARLKPVNVNTLEGQSDDGRVLTLTRE